MQLLNPLLDKPCMEARGAAQMLIEKEFAKLN